MPNSLSELAARITALEQLLRDLSRSSRLANSSIENGAITVYDADGTLRGSIGVQDDGTVAVAAVNGPPPPVPSAPTVTSVSGGVAVAWDGTFADGSTAPADFAYVEVHFATDADFPGGGSLFSAFYSASGGTMLVPAGGPLWVRLACVSTSNAASAPSAPVGPVGPAPVVAQAVLDGIVTELALADGAVSAAKLAAAAVESNALAAGAVTTASMTAGSISGDRLAVGTIAADRIAAASITASQIKALGITGDRLAVNTITADKLAAGTITAVSGVISSIDANKITTGTLDASKVAVTNLDASTIKAGTISVDRLSVGLQGSTGQKFYDFGDSASKWVNAASGSMTTVAVADAQSGGSVMRCVGYIQGAYRGDIRIPFDPSVSYRVSARVRQTVANATPGASQTLYVGVTGFAADAVTLVNNSGANSTSSQFYFAATATPLTAGAGWVTYTGYFKGTSTTPGGTHTNAASPGTLHPNVRYISPCLYANYNGGSGTVELDMFAIEVVESGAITASNIVAGAIDGQTITGADIRTAATGQRIEIVPNGPLSWDNGDHTFNPPGVVWYTGNLDEVAPGELTQYLRSSEFGSQPVVELRTPDVGYGIGSLMLQAGNRGGDTAGMLVEVADMTLMVNNFGGFVVGNSTELFVRADGTDNIYFGSVSVGLVQKWTTPALVSGYSGNGNSNGSVQFRVIDFLGTPFVQWRGGLNLTYSSSGAIANGGAPFSAALPAAARPSARRTVPVASSLSAAPYPSLKIDFDTTGAVSIVGTTASVNPPWVSFNSVLYSL